MRKLILGCTMALSMLIGWLWLLPLAGALSNITVTTTSDAILDDGLCSIREAIIAANTDTASGSLSGECAAGSGADTIHFSPNLSPATFVLTRAGANEDSALTGDLDIVGTLIINGAGAANTVVDGDGTDRVLQILPGARVTIAGVTVRNGNPGAGADGGGVAVDLTARLTLNDSTVISNTAVSGGGVKVLGLLTLNDSTVENNQGGGIHNDAGLLLFTNAYVISNTGGYGINNQNGATLSFDGGMVSGNQGGGIYNATSTATLNNLSIISNTVGGGVHNVGTTSTRLTLSNSAVMSNTATSGGGILNDGLGAQASIDHTRVSFNTATAAGGGINNNGSMTLADSTIDHNQARTGGGIDHSGFSLQMTNDTLSNNTANDNGGGLYNRSSATLTNVTLDGNAASGLDTGGNIYDDGSSAQLIILHTIVANAGAGGNCANNGGILTSAGHNLESANTCGFAATGDITNTNPLLGPLQDNGGPTFTHALRSGSPAVDQGDNASCPATDQRGVIRPQGIACDIGAYESGDTADLSVGKARQGTGSVVAGERITYTITVTNVGPAAPITATVVDTWSPIAAVVGVDAPGCSVDLGGGAITCTRTALGLGAVLLPNPYVVFTTSAAFSGTLTNVATVTTTEGVTDANLANNATGPVLVSVVTGGTPPVTETDLSVGKERQGTGSVLAGERITYTITVTNVGPAAPITATVVDTWSPITAVVGVDAPGCSVDLGGGVITCTRTALGLGAVFLPDPYVVFTTSAAFSGTLTNVATVTATEGVTDGNLANNATDPVLVSVVTGGTPPVTETDLLVGKARQGTGTVLAGERITYTITVTNVGPAAPITTTVVDTWSPITAVVGIDAPGCSVDLSGGAITCTRTALGLGAVLLPDPHVVFTTSAAFSGTLTNVATVTATGGITDANRANNATGPVLVSVVTGGTPPVVETDLSIAKQRQGTGAVVAGERITYTITVTNVGPAAPITATVVDTWSPIAAVVGVDAPGCSVDLGGGAITCTRTALGLGVALLPDPYVVFTTSATFSGTLTNVATVTATGGITDGNLANNATGPVLVSVATGSAQPVVETDLSVGKVRQGTGAVLAGERITYTITVTNAGPAAPITVTVVDTWSPITAVVGIDAPGCSVDLGGGVITCTHTALGLGAVLLPDPYVVFTTSAAFSGTLTNVATVVGVDGVDDINPANDTSDPIVVTLIRRGSYRVYLPVVLNNALSASARMLPSTHIGP